MINHDDALLGLVIMNRDTKRWYLIVARTLQGLMVASLEVKGTPIPLHVILVKDYRSWDFEEKVKETKLEKEIKEWKKQ